MNNFCKVSGLLVIASLISLFQSCQDEDTEGAQKDTSWLCFPFCDLKIFSDAEISFFRFIGLTEDEWSEKDFLAALKKKASEGTDVDTYVCMSLQYIVRDSELRSNSHDFVTLEDTDIKGFENHDFDEEFRLVEQTELLPATIELFHFVTEPGEVVVDLRSVFVKSVDSKQISDVKVLSKRFRLVDGQWAEF